MRTAEVRYLTPDENLAIDPVAREAFPEIRALASRYGNPDEVLAEDWAPYLPGINAPGTYDSYARDPGAYWTRWARSIDAGTYEFFKP